MIITRRMYGTYDADAPAAGYVHAHWRDQNAVLCASTRRAAFPPIVSPLSIKTMSRGAATFVRQNRRVGSDDDHYLVFNEGDVYATSIHVAQPLQAFCVYFRPGMHEEVAAAMKHDLDTALERGPRLDREPICFSTHLRAHDNTVSPALAHIRTNVIAGRTEDDWYEEAFHDLLVQLIEADRTHHLLADRFDSAKRSTREELLRRIGWAADFINSSYMDAITLDNIACAASLSKFHLARLFRQSLGITPHNYLQRKRTQVARRLIDTTDMDLGEVALAAGFGSRWTTYRFLRKSCGAGGRRLRGEPIAA